LQLQGHKNTDHNKGHFPKRIPKVSSELVIVGKLFSNVSKIIEHGLSFRKTIHKARINILIHSNTYVGSRVTGKIVNS
jgi:hypothetical protein